MQAGKLEMWLPAEVARRALASEFTLGWGIEVAVEEYLGIEIDGASRCRLTDTRDGWRKVLIESPWKPPSKE